MIRGAKVPHDGRAARLQAAGPQAAGGERALNWLTGRALRAVLTNRKKTTK
jgi:hypothetical protein